MTCLTKIYILHAVYANFHGKHDGKSKHLHYQKHIYVLLKMYSCFASRFSSKYLRLDVDVDFDTATRFWKPKKVWKRRTFPMNDLNLYFYIRNNSTIINNSTAKIPRCDCELCRMTPINIIIMLYNLYSSCLERSKQIWGTERIRFITYHRQRKLQSINAIIYNPRL